uniref:Uncharacterized protein n=1 Tax=Anguilla anguilla TaxID=7936 RepID=A0A0E9QKZ8_ANGAN
MSTNTVVAILSENTTPFKVTPRRWGVNNYE